MAKTIKTFDDQLREEIRKSGMTSYALGKAAGIGQPQIDRFMAGERDVRIETAGKIAAVLGLRISVWKLELANRDENSRPEVRAFAQAVEAFCDHPTAKSLDVLVRNADRIFKDFGMAVEFKPIVKLIGALGRLAIRTKIAIEHDDFIGQVERAADLLLGAIPRGFEKAE